MTTVNEVELLERPTEDIIGVMNTPVENRDPNFGEIVDARTKLSDHITMATFLFATGVLVASLGSTAERKDLIRHVLFLEEET